MSQSTAALHNLDDFVPVAAGDTFQKVGYVLGLGRQANTGFNQKICHAALEDGGKLVKEQDIRRTVSAFVPGIALCAEVDQFSYLRLSQLRFSALLGDSLTDEMSKLKLPAHALLP